MQAFSMPLFGRALIGGLLLASIGCVGKGLLNWKQPDIPQADDKNPAVKVICIWEPANGRGVDGLPTRGFAGQLFFTQRDDTPVQVDGDVRVYVFENRGTPEEQARPIRQFDFKGDVWTMHLMQSTPGPSYGLFIPYTGEHPYQTSCSLRVRLTPASGPTIFSEVVHIMLPGLVEKTDSDSEPTKPVEPKLARRSFEFSDIRLGATIDRRQSPATNTAHVARAPASSPRVDKAFSQSSNYLETSAAIPGGNPVRLMSAQQQAGPLDSGSGSDVDQTKLQKIERLLQELKQEQQRPVVQQPAQPPPRNSRRFRLAPTGSASQWNPRGSAPAENGPDTGTTGQMPARQPHPLGAMTPDPVKRAAHPLADN